MRMTQPTPAAGGGVAASTYSGYVDIVQADVDAGTKTITIGATLPNATYVPVVYLIDSNRNIQFPVPQIPSDADAIDSRTTTQFAIDPPDVGRCYWIITIGS